MTTGLHIFCTDIYRLRPELKNRCCGSCHDDYEDEELRLDLCAVEGPGLDLGDHSGGVCCALSRYLEEFPLTSEEVQSLRVACAARASSST